MSDQETKSGLEYIENPALLADKVGQVEQVLEKNSKIIYGIGGGILAAVLLYFAYNWYIGGQDKDAQAALSSAVFAYEADSLNKALKGSGGNPGLTRIADEYSATDAGNLAKLYAGTALLKQGKFDDAIESLKSFSASDLLVQARAYALIGDAYMEKGSFDDAISYYKKAVDYKPNLYFTPTYMMKLAVAYEKAKNNEEAANVYGDLVEKYPLSPEVANAKKFKSLIQPE